MKTRVPMSTADKVVLTRCYERQLAQLERLNNLLMSDSGLLRTARIVFRAWRARKAEEGMKRVCARFKDERKLPGGTTVEAHVDSGDGFWEIADAS